MTILEIILGIAFLVAVIGLGYYMITINRFKRFLHFEADAKANPSDDKVREYMKLYEKTYIPNQPHIRETRATFYRAIKESDQVSYEVKKELRSFFEAKEITVLTTLKKDIPDED
jgi:hypothetical protein